MPDLAMLSALQERLLAARREDRKLDADIARALLNCAVRNVSRLGLSGRTPGRMRMIDAYGKEHDVPRLTGSVDAALALVEKLLPGRSWRAGNTLSRADGTSLPGAFCRLGTSTKEHEAATASLAICSALLAALIAQSPTDTGERHG